MVLWRLRYKLSFRDLAEMYSVKGFYFTREAIRQWEAGYALLFTDELKTPGWEMASLRWKVDETLVKIKNKFYYLYRAIDHKDQLVDVKLSEVRNSESATAFFEQEVKTVGH